MLHVRRTLKFNGRRMFAVHYQQSVPPLRCNFLLCGYLESTMDIQRLRNLTTGRLHTEMGHIYEDLGVIVGDDGIMTHMIPRVMRAIEPWLREQVTDPRFWDGEHDTTHTGDHPLRSMTPAENKAALERYAAMPDPLAGKEVIPVVVGD
jgi:hypothetical protein